MVRTIFLGLGAFAAIGCDDTVFEPHGFDDDQGVLFAADWDGVSAFMEARCSGCHPTGGTRYAIPEDVEADVLAGTEALVVPGDPDASLIWRVLVSDGVDGEPISMPQTGKLSYSQVQHVRLWILDGAEL